MRNNPWQFRSVDYLVIALLFSLSFYASLHLFLSLDVSWHMEAAKQILMAPAHGKNIFDDNPPMVFWIFIPIVWLHQTFSISLIKLCMLYAHLLALMSFALSNIYLKDILPRAPAWEIRVIRYTILIALLFLCINEYAQREMLLMAFCLPYCILMAARIQTHSKLHWHNGYFLSLLGLCMAIGIAMNPMQGIIIVVLEIQLWITQKKLRLFRPEFLTLTTGLLFYLCLIAVVFPQYYTENIPSFFAFSPDCNATYTEMFQNLHSTFVWMGLFTFAIFYSLDSTRSWKTTLFFCAIATYFIYFLNHKVWSFHLYPSMVFTLLLLISILCTLIKMKPKNMLVIATGFLCVFSLSIIIVRQVALYKLSVDYYNDANNDYHKMIDFFNHQPPKKSIISFSLSAVQMFPLLTYTSLNYVAPFPNCWAITGIIKSSAEINQLSPWKKAWTEKYKRHFQESLNTILATQKPDFVIVDIQQQKLYLEKRQVNYVDFFNQDPTFHRLWKHYHLKKTIPHYYAIYEYKN